LGWGGGGGGVPIVSGLLKTKKASLTMRRSIDIEALVVVRTKPQLARQLYHSSEEVTCMLEG